VIAEVDLLAVMLDIVDLLAVMLDISGVERGAEPGFWRTYE